MNETPFRFSLAILFFLSMGTAARFRIRAARAGGAVSRRDEGWLKVPLRLAGLLLWIGALAWLIEPTSMDWGQIYLPLKIRWGGVFLAAIGLGMMYWTLHTLGLNLTDTVAVRPKATLVTTGLYRWIRHPFYVAFLVLGVGVAMITDNLFLFLCVPLVFVLLWARCGREEQKLLEHFGQPYREYMRNTGRFFPRLSDRS